MLILLLLSSVIEILVSTNSFKNFYKIFYVISVGILPLVLIPGLGVEANGATRWIDLGFIQFQPSEITKIGLIIFYAGYLTDHKSELKKL